MIITIFGASSSIGIEIVKQALVMGHTVKAFGRNVFATDFLKHDNLQLIQGALFDAGDVKAALAGSDAVLSVIGGATDGTDKSRSLGMKNIIAQMEATDVKRIVALGGIGALPVADGSSLMEAKDFPKELEPVSQEHVKVSKMLESSRLDWTFVAAPGLVDAAAVGSFSILSEAGPDSYTQRINKGDLAMFMLNELTRNKYIGKRVGLTN